MKETGMTDFGPLRVVIRSDTIESVVTVLSCQYDNCCDWRVNLDAHKVYGYKNNPYNLSRYNWRDKGQSISFFDRIF